MFNKTMEPAKPRKNLKASLFSKKVFFFDTNIINHIGNFNNLSSTK